MLFQPVGAATHAESLPEPAVRYTFSNLALTAAEIGIATLDGLQRTAAIEGPLPQGALDLIRDILAGFAAGNA